MKKKLGVIGGSGLYEMESLTEIKTHKVSTPFGDPSDEYISGMLGETEVYFLPRHGKGHRFLPSEVNYRANIYGFKKLGIDWLLSASAVGSMKEEIVPGHMVLPDQFIDRTHRRIGTFLGNGIVGHVAFGDPVCKKLRSVLKEAALSSGATTHDGGTYVCMEGPLFSTRAESLSYKALGVSVIGMTNMPEAKLAREAGMSYATLALATDYDCWYEGHDDVTLETVMKVMRENVAMAKKIIVALAAKIPAGPSPFRGTLKNAIVTDRAMIPPATLEALQLFFE